MNGKNVKPIKVLHKLHKDNLTGKEVEMDLAGLDGNAFSLMGAFQREAQQQGWDKEEIALVLEECRSSDYNHLLQTLLVHITSK